ncbi:hypothetical protein [Chryseobacterium koreense]|uniref:Uncharacterized protein n=1 Tax=Chryseobacterium koreense CCUG 49689 TaxID=1304281 RepID=A0A0J7J3Z0_9FLAO|nr:hypothetical protein [Chryseobacterium koreense]KMQ72646.1 hypothetical protein ACM44_00710 [Chryseobacterium koreense CCUG 49689]MBB5333046.1 Ca2+/Na+ antiporter [Chryseobacterium koreense]
MKRQLYFYIAMIMTFIIYNQFFQVADPRLNTIINILFASFLFLYIGYMAFVLLKRMKNAAKTHADKSIKKPNKN